MYMQGTWLHGIAPTTTQILKSGTCPSSAASRTRYVVLLIYKKKNTNTYLPFFRSEPYQVRCVIDIQKNKTHKHVPALLPQRAVIDIYVRVCLSVCCVHTIRTSVGLFCYASRSLLLC